METRRPCSTEDERELIGTMLQFPGDADDAFTTLAERDFDNATYRKLFLTMREFYMGDEWGEMGPDWSNLYLKAGVLNRSEIVKMAQEAVSGAQIPGLINKLQDLTRRRAIVDAGLLMAHKASDYSLDSKDLLMQAGGYIDDAAVSEAKAPVPILNIVERLIDNYKTERSKKGVATGLKELDDLWAGFIAPELTVIGARPSMGKTQLSLYLAQQVAEQTGLPVGIFSLEMSEDQVGLRYVAADLGVEVDLLRREKVSQDKIDRMQGEILTKYAKSKIFIQDEPDMTTLDILGQARKMKRTMGLGLLVVDYLNLIADKKGRDDTRATLFENMTRRIRSIGKKLEVPTLLLAQLNRDCEKRDNKRPVLSDLKESGGIEACANNIIFLYRDNYYKPDIEDNTLEIIIAKQTQGPRGVTAFVNYEPETGRFTNRAPRYREEESIAWGGAYQ